MSKNIKNKEKEFKVKFIVSRTFGKQNLLEIYSDYVAKKLIIFFVKKGRKKMKKNLKIIICTFDLFILLRYNECTTIALLGKRGRNEK